MPATSVRRNLFNSNFSKRSVPSAPPMQGANNNVSNVQSSRSVTVSSETNQSSLNATAGSTDNGEIVVKDNNGGYKLDIPVLPLVGAGKDGGEMEGFDESQNGGGSAATIVNSNGETEIDGQEKERIEASLIEMVRRNRNRQMSSEPTEIYNIIQQSLRNKVAALEEDNWMYEIEVEPRASRLAMPFIVTRV